MKAELEKQKEELINIEDDRFNDWNLVHENFCPVNVMMPKLIEPALHFLIII